MNKNEMPDEVWCDTMGTPYWQDEDPGSHVVRYRRADLPPEGMEERCFYWTDPHGFPDDDGAYLSPCADDDERAVRIQVPLEEK